MAKLVRADKVKQNNCRTLIPCLKHNIIQKSDYYQVIAIPAQLELRWDGILDSGWFLLRGKLQRRSSDFSAILIAEPAEPELSKISFELPISLKGNILELLKFPFKINKLLLQPMNAVGEFNLSTCTLQPVKFLERIIRQWQRVFPMYYRQPQARRERIGLLWHTPLFNLQRAYQLAGRLRAYAPVLNYGDWLDQFDHLTKQDRRTIQRMIKTWSIQYSELPHFYIFIILKSNQNQQFTIESTWNSIKKQLYQHFTIILLTEDPINFHFDQKIKLYSSLKDSNLTNFIDLIKSKQSTWILILNSGMTLSEHALYWFTHEILSNNFKVGIIYCDHDELENEQRTRPCFKPDWSPELLRSTNYFNQSLIIRTDLFQQHFQLTLQNCGELILHDLILRVTETLINTEIIHIPALLWHIPASFFKLNNLNHQPLIKNPVNLQLIRLNIAATVIPTSGGHYRIRYHLPKNSPLVSILIPTKNNLNYLKACITSILNYSTYPNFNLIIIDNQSTDQDTLNYLHQINDQTKIKILRYEQEFNYSAINNFAAQIADGEILCLLNNDTEVITSDWLEEMVGHLIQPKVGVVGAKLYFSDGRVQHAGDTVGPGGCAHHLHTFLTRDEPGYCERAILAQDLSAVTAACLLTWKNLFFKLGGLDEKNLAISFNDVDYCLRVREAGLRVVWTPYAELYHHESISRGQETQTNQLFDRKAEAEYIRKKWQHLMDHDPFYNPNLSYQRPDFSLSPAPVLKRPWHR